MKENLYRDLCQFAALQLSSKDNDPAYPMLAWLQRDMEYADSVRHTLNYVAFYNIASAQASWYDSSLIKLPTGTERRGLRVPEKMREHQNALWEVTPAYLQRGFVYGSRKQNWNALMDNLKEVRFNGRWAAYKTSEILWKVNGFDVEAPDMGNDDSSGPVDGLRLLFGNNGETVKEMDEQARGLQARMWANDIPIHISELETVLCDFNSMSKGHYYNGNDIDMIQEQIQKAPLGVKAELYLARHESLPKTYLGELQGWSGVRRGLKQAYKLTGKVVSGAV